MYDQARFTVKFNKLCSFVEDEMRALRDILDPESDPSDRMFRSVEESLAMQNDYTKIRMHSVVDRKYIEETAAPKSMLRKLTHQATSVLPSSIVGSRLGSKDSSA